MAQRPFISDMGIRLGEWLLTQNSDGDITAGPVGVDLTNSQRAFRADHGVKIGNWELYIDGQDLSVSENRSMAGSQRPFIADAGFKISDWTFTQDTDGDMLLSTTAIVSSGTVSGSSSGSGSSSDSGSGSSSYTYAIAITNSSGQAVTTVAEGGTYTITVTTTAPDDTRVWVTRQEDSESEQPGDSALIDFLMNGIQASSQAPTVTNGVVTIQLDIIADNTTELGYEKLRFVVSSDDDGPQFNGDGAGVTPWVTITDNSQDPVPDLTQYNWTFSTSVDIGANKNPNTGEYYLMSNYSDPTVTAQIVEGDYTQTWTITTNAPNGSQVYAYRSNVYMGAYDYQDDPSGNSSEFYYQGEPYGWYTVQNGEISGIIEPVPDGYDEDGEVFQFKIKDSSSWSSGQYNQLATTEWIHLIDEGQSTSSGNTSFSLSPSGTQVVAGEQIADSGTASGYWVAAADSTTGNNQIQVRVSDEGNQRSQDILHWLDNLTSGQDVDIWAMNPNWTNDLTWADFDSIQTTSGTTVVVHNSTYSTYYFDVDTAPTGGLNGANGTSFYFGVYRITMP